MTSKIDFIESAPGYQFPGFFKPLKVVWSLVLLAAVFTVGCSKDSSNPTPDPAVSSSQLAVRPLSRDIDFAPVNLRTAGNFTILSATGISTTGVTSIVGNIGVSPIAATAITGFGLIMDASGQFSHTPIVIGKVYAAKYTAPTPSNMTIVRRRNVSRRSKRNSSRGSILPARLTEPRDMKKRPARG